MNDGGDPELDEMLRQLERLLDARDWDGVVALRDRARASFERGRQHWPVAAHAEYRLALEAPAEYAGAVIVEGAGQFALGPLAEVAASTHSFDELRDHVPGGPLRTVVAHERVVRGEDLSGDMTLDPEVLPIPFALEAFEPRPYPVATYHRDKADFPAPEPPQLSSVTLPSETRAVTLDLHPLIDIAATWTAQSNGTVSVAAVEGGALDAIAALGMSAARVAEVAPADALALLAWAAASGGAEGRRRGMAWGRCAAWSAVAAVAEVEGDALAEVIGDLRFHLWDAARPETGWICRIAIEDRVEGIAVAFSALDSKTLAHQRGPRDDRGPISRERDRDTGS